MNTNNRQNAIFVIVITLIITFGIWEVTATGNQPQQSQQQDQNAIDMPTSASGVWMSVTYPTNYLSYGYPYTYTQYIPVKVEVWNNSQNPYKGIKIVLTATACNSANPSQCQTMTQTKYSNSQGVAVFIEVLPYLVSNVGLNVKAYNNGNVAVANYFQDINHIGD